MPYKEKRRLHGRAYRAQQKNHLEICGIFTSLPENKIKLYFLKNQSNKPYSYELNIRVIRNMRKILLNNNEKILGSFHSHPIGKPIPGKGDIKRGFYKGMEMIYDVCARELKMWRISKKKNNKYQLREIPLEIESKKRDPKNF